jgi:hypothetical protein
VGLTLVEFGLDKGGAHSSVDLLLTFSHHDLLECSLTLLHCLIFHTCNELLELRTVLVLCDLVTKDIFGIFKHLETHQKGSVFNSDARLHSKCFAIDPILKQLLVAVFSGDFAIMHHMFDVFFEMVNFLLVEKRLVLFVV